MVEIYDPTHGDHLKGATPAALQIARKLHELFSAWCNERVRTAESYVP